MFHVRTGENNGSPEYWFDFFFWLAGRIVQDKFAAVSGFPVGIEVGYHRELPSIFALEIVEVPVVVGAGWVRCVQAFESADPGEAGAVEVVGEGADVVEVGPFCGVIGGVGPPPDVVGPDFCVDFGLAGGADGRRAQGVLLAQGGEAVAEVGQDLVWEKAINQGPALLQNLLHNAFETLLNGIHGNQQK